MEGSNYRRRRCASPLAARDRTYSPVVSPDGKALAYSYSDSSATPITGIAILSLETGAVVTSVDHKNGITGITSLERSKADETSEIRVIWWIAVGVMHYNVMHED
jgi:hypothetical protein